MGQGAIRPGVRLEPTYGIAVIPDVVEHDGRRKAELQVVQPNGFARVYHYQHPRKAAASVPGMPEDVHGTVDRLVLTRLNFSARSEAGEVRVTFFAVPGSAELDRLDRVLSNVLLRDPPRYLSPLERRREARRGTRRRRGCRRVRRFQFSEETVAWVTGGGMLAAIVAAYAATAEAEFTRERSARLLG